MTKRKKARGQTVRHPLDTRRAIVEAIGHTFIGELIDPGPPARYEILGRYPVYELLIVFESIEWGTSPFDPEALRVPGHPPKGKPHPGCLCLACELANTGWRIEDVS